MVVIVNYLFIYCLAEDGARRNSSFKLIKELRDLQFVLNPSGPLNTQHILQRRTVRISAEVICVVFNG